MRIVLGAAGVALGLTAGVCFAQGGGSGEPANPASLCVDKCGDGDCQEIVCLGEACPCAESAESCPQDCAPQD